MILVVPGCNAALIYDNNATNKTELIVFPSSGSIWNDKSKIIGEKNLGTYCCDRRGSRAMISVNILPTYISCGDEYPCQLSVARAEEATNCK